MPDLYCRFLFHMIFSHAGVLIKCHLLCLTKWTPKSDRIREIWLLNLTLYRPKVPPIGVNENYNFKEYLKFSIKRKLCSRLVRDVCYLANHKCVWLLFLFSFRFWWRGYVIMLNLISVLIPVKSVVEFFLHSANKYSRGRTITLRRSIAYLLECIRLINGNTKAWHSQTHFLK